MIIDFDNGFIFVHIPKVAGISISEALGGYVGVRRYIGPMGELKYFGSHAYARSIKNFVGEQYQDFFSFAFVRNPWDRLYSLYNFMCNSPRTQRPVGHDNTPIGGGSIPDQNALKSGGFKRFLLEYDEKTTLVGSFHNMTPEDINREGNYVDQRLTPQVRWLTDEKGEIIVDAIGRFENLQHDFAIVVDTLDLDVQLPHKNQHTKQDYREVYDQEMIDFVSEYHKEDIITFGYTFDGENKTE